MEIVRNGQKILLTEWELFQAYEEQKYLYLKESVLENMEDCLPKEMYSKLKANEDYKERSITLFQKYSDNPFLRKTVDAAKADGKISVKEYMDIVQIVIKLSGADKQVQLEKTIQEL